MENIEKKIIEIRRKIHQHPELGNREFKTVNLIEKTLKNAGIRTMRVGKTGVVGILNSQPSLLRQGFHLRPDFGGQVGGQATLNSQHCIALRADIDALPIEEKTGKPYASKVKGLMHACGHDANTAVVLGAALILSKERKKNFGRVKFIFQPNEESAGGAKKLIKAGVLNNPKVKAIIGIHANPRLSTGKIGIRYGEVLAAVDRFHLKIIGEGGHGASPHEGKDAIAIASQVVQALQNIVSRQIDPVEPAVITIGTINGGERFNILAQKVEMNGTVRTLNEKLHRKIPKLMERTIRGICSAWGARYEFDYEIIAHPLINSSKLVKFCEEVVKKELGEQNAVIIKKPSMGGEDFADYLRYIPGCFLYLGTNKGRDTSYIWHHPKFDIDERVLFAGSKLLAAITLNYLNPKGKNSY